MTHNLEALLKSTQGHSIVSVTCLIFIIQSATKKFLPHCRPELAKQGWFTVVNRGQPREWNKYGA